MGAAPAAEAAAIETLYSAEEIGRRIDRLAEEIASRPLQELLIVAVLKGSFIFAADLIRALQRRGLAPEIDFIFLQSYGAATQSSGRVEVLRDVGSPVEGRDVVLVDDILDSGRTLDFARRLLLSRGARQLLTCVLVEKEVPRAVAVEADLAAFRCPPTFIVGYGMDLANRYRELPFIGVLKSDASEP